MTWAGFMRKIRTGISPHFSYKPCNPDRKSEELKNSDFMRGKQRVLPDLLRRKDIPKTLVVKCLLRGSNLKKKTTLNFTIVDDKDKRINCSIVFVRNINTIPEKMLAFLVEELIQNKCQRKYQL